jgi:hypothetical protein
MITRIWHGRVYAKDANAYREYVMKTGIPEYLIAKGNQGAQILMRKEGSIVHIYTVTQWESLECIKNFAGNDIETAKYYKEDEKYLLELEPNVMHCETWTFS